MTPRQFASLRVGDVIKVEGNNEFTVAGIAFRLEQDKIPGTIIAKTPEQWTLIRRAKRKTGK